jgi:chemotaxis signal transduction protein
MRTTASKLKQAFDASFAEPPRAEREATEDFLAVRIGGDPYAIRVAEILGLYADRKVVPVPTSTPELLGLVGLRGAVVPVYDLRVLLGYPGGAAPRWLILCGAPPAGLAFDAFETHERVARADVLPAVDPGRRRHTAGAFRAGQGARTIISIAAVLEAIGRGPK